MPAVRLIALVHDLTHSGYGHTLEDEICVFEEKHDDPSRQARFFDALVAQLLMKWRIECGICDPDPDELENLMSLGIDSAQIDRWVDEVSAVLRDDEREKLLKHLLQLDFALRLLLHLEFFHSDGGDVPKVQLAVSRVIQRLSSVGGLFGANVQAFDLNFHRDGFFLDIVGNTICADLLDYARRDCRNAGVHVDFDQRLLRYLVVVSVNGTLSPDGRPVLHTAVQFYTDKMRHDVLTEMSAILKVRYIEHERILLHPAKCAAGALLGTATQLLGVSALPPWVQALGDQAFLGLLAQIAVALHDLCGTARNLEEEPQGLDEFLATALPKGSRLSILVRTCLSNMLPDEDATWLVLRAHLEEIEQRARSARLLLWNLSARCYPRLVYRLRSELKHSGEDGDEEIAERYSDPAKRYRLERELEQELELPQGAVVIHCPQRKTAMKVAAALVVGRDMTKVARLRDVTDICKEGLVPYQSEIRAVEEMYRSIWQFHVFLDGAHFRKWRLLVNSLNERHLHFPNDALLMADLERKAEKDAYYILATDLKDKAAVEDLPRILERLDTVVRNRQGSTKPESVALEAIEHVTRQKFESGTKMKDHPSPRKKKPL